MVKYLDNYYQTIYSNHSDPFIYMYYQFVALRGRNNIMWYVLPLVYIASIKGESYIFN